MRVLLLAPALAVAGSSVACGGRCQTDVRESTFELAPDELDMECEEICAEAPEDGWAFDGCSRTKPGVDPPMVTCTFSLETCDSGGGF
ncbi:hypothetical protein [Polyangium jinanense]|uniref:Lipoprotein n=1 Tax=Polyangium jinanense TaxID=2829994 RepID=A0A9X3XD88_9BACT|nr:hypothetical protein [Polyangium jinanense]MDC3957107.1 hypothetical protein [Polyangium jinanense]MDC3986863.1 hypothetical protein [Polyangium jinanense]